jgi:hypothetical protein
MIVFTTGDKILKEIPDDLSVKVYIIWSYMLLILGISGLLSYLGHRVIV